MKVNRINRRMFLQGSGGALVSIPFLTSLLPRETWAQTAPAVIKRFMTIHTNYDIGHNSYWMPNNGSTTQIRNLPQPNRVATGINGHHDVRYQPLREFAPTNSSVLSPLYGAVLSPYLESMNILRSLDLTNRYGHGHAHVMGGILHDDHVSSGFQKIPTIDYLLNNNKRFNPNGLPLITTQYSGEALSQSISGSNVVSTSRTSDLYNGLFANGSFPESSQSGTTTHPRSSVMNRVMEDYTRIRNSRNISSEDKLILDNVFDKFSDIQKSFTTTSTAQCQYKTLANKGAGVHNAIEGKVLADLITASFMCDSTRVISFQLDTSYGLGVVDGQEFDHQITSHDPFLFTNGKYQWQRMGDRQAYVIKNLVAPLVQNLSSVTEANGKSILYNSLLNVSYEAGQVHGWGSVPAILFGNAGGAITSGNYIDYADRAKGSFDGSEFSQTPEDRVPGALKFANNWHGVSQNRLLVTILQAMGITPAEYENNALNSQLYNRTDIGALNNNISNIGGYGYAIPVKIDGRPNWDDKRPALAKYDLKQFKYKLPIL